MSTTRRQFIATSACATLGMTLSSPLTQAAGPARRIPIGFQLYTVRGAFAKDVPGTLQRLGEIGYRAVEFWGYGGTPEVYQKYSAKELAGFLRDSGLKCCGIHLEPKALAKENLERTVENNRILGNEYLNVAAAADQMKTEATIAEFAAFLNAAAEQCRPHRMRVGYHAHPFDFARIGGRFAWDLLFSQTRPEINMQIDVGNTLAGNGDPIAMLKKYPGRTWTIHIKEHEEKTFDSAYYKEVFTLCETTANTHWYIVEMGDSEGAGFDIPKQALAKLHALGK